MLTRKDYIAIAALLKAERGEHFDSRPYPAMTDWEKGAYDQWHTVTLNMADWLQKDNPRFDRARFLTACGVQP